MSVHVTSGNYLTRTIGVPASHQDFAFGRWVKRESDSGANECIAHIGSGTNPIQLWVNDNDEVRLVLQYSGSRVINAGTLLPGEWLYVAAKFLGTVATLAWRREDEAGLSVATTTNSGGDWTTDRIYLGRDSSTAVADMLYAYERWWDTGDITISELLAESSSAVAVRTTDLLSDHPFDGANLAACLEDESGNDNDWTAVGTPTVDADMPTLEAASSTGVPDADVSAGPWTASAGSDLYAMIDESVADDGDYITASSSGTCEIALGAMSEPPGGWATVVRYRIDGDVTVAIYDGSTEIASWVHTSVASPTTFAQTLSSGEQSAITDWSNLRLRFTKP